LGSPQGFDKLAGALRLGVIDIVAFNVGMMFNISTLDDVGTVHDVVAMYDVGIMNHERTRPRPRAKRLISDVNI
jgi:hypothetical protein